MKNIFQWLPYPFKYIFINIFGFFLVKRRFTKSFYNILEQYKRLDYIEEFKFNEKLFLDQFSGTYPFNKKNINEYDVVDKHFIKENYEDIINKKYVTNYLYTSGTTGSGLKFPVTQEFMENQWAVFWKFRNIHGISMNTWCAYIIGQTLFETNTTKESTFIKSYFTKQLLFSQYHLDDKRAKVYLNAILKNKIKWLHSYPSVLNNFANLIKKENLYELVNEINFDIITVSSEKLFEFQKQNIESTFGCEIRELYGLTEGVVNIFECECGVLHIDESYSYVELIKKEHSKEYDIIGTSYHNKAFPLIRYKTGDTCILYDDGKDFICNCGRKSRTVKEILGRDEDYLVLHDGRKVGRLDHLFKNMFDIEEAQIYQTKKGGAVFRIKKGKNYNEKSEIKLTKEIREKLGNDFIFDIEYLKHIPKTKSGKLKFLVSEVV